MQNIPSDLSQTLVQIKDTCKTSHTELHQQLDNIIIRNDTKFQSLESAFKHGAQQLEETILKQNATFDKLKMESNSNLQQQLNKLQGELQACLSQKFEEYIDRDKKGRENRMSIESLENDILRNKNELTLAKDQIKIEKENCGTVQKELARALAGLKQKAKEISALEESLNEVQVALRQSQSDHVKIITQHTKEIQHYKNINTAEKSNSIKVQESLSQVSADLKEKTKETVALKERECELQSTVQKLEDALRQYKSQHDIEITECAKKIEQYKNLRDAEKENVPKVQSTSTQVSAE